MKARLVICCACGCLAEPSYGGRRYCERCIPESLFKPSPAEPVRDFDAHAAEREHAEGMS